MILVSPRIAEIMVERGWINDDGTMNWRAFYAWSAEQAKKSAAEDNGH